MEQSKAQNSSIQKVSENWLIEHGYIKTEIFGWEKPEFLKMFDLSPDLKGVPAVQIEVTENGKTRKVWVASKNYLEYKKFKKDLYIQHLAEKYNTPKEDVYTE